MKARHLTSFLAVALAAVSAEGATFTPKPMVPDAGVERMDRAVAREHLDRELFADPYATVVIGNVDLYETFPYVEARYFMVVSDPQWNRLLYSELGGTSLFAFDGAGSDVGPLLDPRGMAVDASGRVYVCDTGNNRLVVLETRSEFDRLELYPVQVIEGLSRPFDVAFSDLGTPFEEADDRLYVAETGENRVARLVRDADGFQVTSTLGELGSAPGCFAGPMSIAVGRLDGVSTNVVYVADAHNRRLVELVDDGDGLQWRGARAHDADVVTSLETDHWGNLYATSPAQSEVAKYSSSLSLVARISGTVERPSDFHVPFVTVRDHRDGSRTRRGEAAGLLVEEWTEGSGLRLYGLGVDLSGLHVETDDGVVARFDLTDAGWVNVEVLDPASGTLVAETEPAFLHAGAGELWVESGDVLEDLIDGEYELRVRARSGYEGGNEATATADFSLTGGAVHVASNRAVLLGSSPNPFRPATSVRFRVPSGDQREASLQVFDPSGRLVRAIEAGRVGPGTAQIAWDGRDRNGNEVSSGVYYYRLRVGPEQLEGQVVRIR